MYKAILFDMDGTIVDSVPAWHLTFNQVLTETGGKEITYERFADDVLGQSTEQDIEIFFPGLTEDKLISLYDKYFRTHLASVKLFPDTITTLDYLGSRGLKKAVVTNTPADLMNETLDSLGIKDRFEVILGGTDVEVGKPDPAMIHKACRMLGIAEEEALMVGDTMADIGAGRNAKVATCGIGVKEGDYRVDDLTGLISILESIE
ncbi:HAD family hydrolase [Candidatus Altiarchaeota archaeon]